MIRTLEGLGTWSEKVFLSVTSRLFVLNYTKNSLILTPPVQFDRLEAHGGKCFQIACERKRWRCRQSLSNTWAVNEKKVTKLSAPVKVYAEGIVINHKNKSGSNKYQHILLGPGVRCISSRFGEGGSAFWSTLARQPTANSQQPTAWRIHGLWAIAHLHPTAYKRGFLQERAVSQHDPGMPGNHDIIS